MELPEGLQLMRADGTFYDLEAPVAPVTTRDHFHIGILEPNGILSPFFFHQTMVKVRENGPGNFQLVPLTYTEFLHFPFNRDLTPYNNDAARFILEIRNRQRGRGRG